MKSMKLCYFWLFWWVRSSKFHVLFLVIFLCIHTKILPKMQKWIFRHLNRRKNQKWCNFINFIHQSSHFFTFWICFFEGRCSFHPRPRVGWPVRQQSSDRTFKIFANSDITFVKTIRNIVMKHWKMITNATISNIFLIGSSFFCKYEFVHFFVSWKNWKKS